MIESEHFEENTGFFDREHHGNVDGIKGRRVVAWPLCSIWNFDKKVGLHWETQQKLLLECQWSWALEKIQKSYDGLFKYFTFCKCAPLKMQKMIEQAGPSSFLRPSILLL